MNKLLEFKVLGIGTRCWGFTPIIPATWEAEIRRIAGQGQLGNKIEALSQKYSTQKMGW
jgi:hypothetical protein